MHENNWVICECYAKRNPSMRLSGGIMKKPYCLKSSKSEDNNTQQHEVSVWVERHQRPKEHDADQILDCFSPHFFCRTVKYVQKKIIKFYDLGKNSYDKFGTPLFHKGKLV